MSLRRVGNLFGFLASAAMLGFAYYLQFARELIPCPLCIFERVIIAALGLVFLMALLQHPRRWGRYVYSLLVMIVAAIGVFVSARHLYIQHLPAGQAPVCGASLDTMIHHLPPWEWIRLVLHGSGECSRISFTLLGLSLPGWVLVAMVGLGFFGIWVNSRR